VDEMNVNHAIDAFLSFFFEGITRQESAVSSASALNSAVTCCKKIASWRARMTLNMQTVMILFIMLRMNMPIAMVCMTKKPTSQNTSSKVKNETAFSVSDHEGEMLDVTSRVFETTFSSGAPFELCTIAPASVSECCFALKLFLDFF
jgi:hypothetical protein